ncbi:alpha-2-macroglobulin family protein [Algivirga pacifica]|uniref:Alpha-2-macroglobulin family protein n=1 Tax=Algivirga pacifica TaxID=1162670 RepID=A0ABP9D825_9BACT
MLTQKRSTLFFVLCLSLLIQACSSNKSNVNITYKNFQEEIELKQNITMVFDRDMVNPVQVNHWYEQPVLEITPKVAGKFRWKSTKTLEFSPENGFAPSTSYTMNFTEDFYEMLLDQPKITEEKFTFHTPSLQLERTDTFWQVGQQGEPEIRLTLNFNYEVVPTEIASKLKVTSEGKETSFAMSTTVPAKQIQLALKGSDLTQKSALKIQVQEGLSIANTKMKAKELSYDTKVPSREKFKIVRAETSIHAGKPSIYIYTNQGVSTQQIERYINLSPTIDIEVEKTDFGFILKGAFQTGQQYYLTIEKALKGVFNEELDFEFTQNILFGRVDPAIRFNEKKAQYLSKAGTKKVGIKIVNVPEVEVTLHKIYRNNILAYLKDNGLLYDRGGDDYYYYGYADFSKYGDMVFENTLSTTSLEQSNGSYLIDLGISDQTLFDGIYVLTVRSTDQRYVKDQKVISMSDIGLITKKGKDNITVFTNSILKGETLSDVEITLVSSNNQEVYTVKTDNKGVAVFDNVRQKAPGFTVEMLVASKGDDFNYLHFSQTVVNHSREDIGGISYNATGMMAFLYGDRNLYRPGEKVYLKGIVRNKDWTAAKSFPVKLKVYTPEGSRLIAEQTSLNEEGTFETSFTLPAAALTGSYNVELYTTNNILLGNYQVSVEEFMPDRIKVNVQLDKETVNAGDEVVLSAQALNMFGPPAPGRKYETTFQIVKKGVQPKGLDEYDFSLYGMDNISFEEVIVEGTTGEEGQFQESYFIPEAYHHRGLLEGRVYTTVFDENGRPVHRLSKVDILTQEAFIGVHEMEHYIKSKSAVQLPLAAVSHEGKLLKGVNAKVELVKLNWQSVLEKNDYGRYRYVSRKREQVLESAEITLNGKSTTYSFIPEQSGEYEVRVYLPGAKSYTRRWFYAYAWGASANASFEVDKDGDVLVKSDKEQYEVGETAKVLLNAPFAGKMLVTIEKDELLDYFFVEADEKSAMIEIPMKEEYMPNAYVTATLIKPLEDDRIPLTVAHGVASLSVVKASNRIALDIDVPERSRSNTKQEIIITSELEEEDIEVTVAVVDEGILQIKNYQTPDPFEFFFQKQSLQVDSYDLYPRLLPNMKPQANRFGAGAFDMERRVNPLTNQRVRLLSYWSGTLKTDSDGEVRYTVDIPEFSGSLRVMAVATKADAFGSSSKNIKVADPLVVSTALPRFMSPEDQLKAPITLTNTTDEEMEVSLKLKTDGVLHSEGLSSNRIRIPSNSEKQVLFELGAKKMIGASKVTVTAEAGGEVFKSETDLTVRPITSLVKESGHGKLVAGNKVELDLKKDYLKPRGRLLVSKSPVITFAEHLDELLRYPHGCVEQTVSAVFPQLYFSDLSNALNQETNSQEAAFNVREAIKKLYTMQMYNGGLSYWQGGSYESWWGSVYAAHFMQEADKAGFTVDKVFMDKLYSYLNQRLGQRMTADHYYYNVSGELKSREIARREVFYSLYVLAQAGKKSISTMNYYKEHPDLLTTDAQYMLACTYQLIGDQASFRQLLPPSFGSEKSRKEFGGSFASHVRDQAIALNVLMETNPEHMQVGVLAESLSKAVKEERHLSTQEQAFSFLALGKLSKKTNAMPVKGEILVDGKKVSTYEEGIVTLTKEIISEKVSIEAEGSGDLYYFWELDGLSATGEVEEEDKHLKVRRTFLDRYGREIENNKVQQNDLVVVKITLESDGRSVENVVVTDMLPAGFEVENPRIGELPGISWAKGNTAEHTDFRDDRVHFFTTATAKQKTFYYMVRAVSSGTFSLGPVSADAMYDGSYHSYHGTGTVVVNR